MTETELKLHDAATQMELALSHAGNEEVVRSCVNSFISLARSVTFVMQRESANCPALQEWYEARMLPLKDNPLLRFFNDSRVYSIHKGVVSPVKDTIPIFDFKINGVLQAEEETMTFLRFDNVEKFIPGDNGGVFRLCEQYFIVLKGLVEDWLGKRTELNIS